jgi:hypothetical protein
MLVCRSCGIPKSLVEDFSPRPNGRHGRQAQCKECRKIGFSLHRFKKRHSKTPAMLRKIADTMDEADVIALAKSLILRFKGADRAAVELRRFLEAEFLRGEFKATRAMRGLARIIYVATKVESRSRRQTDHGTADCGVPAIQPAGHGDRPLATCSNRPIYPTPEEMAERARAEEERLRRLGVAPSPGTKPEPRTDSAQESQMNMGAVCSVPEYFGGSIGSADRSRN